mgnify:CR=1 FL=1
MAELRIQSASIVLRGSLNPAIFHPAWFERHGLLRSAEADAAKISVVSPQITSFTTEWLELQVTQDRFQAETSQEAYNESLRDLISGAFELLSHTPVKQKGLNRHFHFLMASESRWHSVGNLLAPKEPWRGILDTPGMQSLTMKGTKPKEEKGYVRVTVEPSNRVSPGVYIAVNDHYELDDVEDKSTAGTALALQFLKARWVDSMQKSRAIADTIVEKGETT